MNHHPEMTSPQGGKTSGFTLIELLIVIFIIAVLAGLATVAVTKVQAKMRSTQARQTISSFETGLNQYFLDHNQYPGYGDPDFDYEVNQFPQLYEALLGEKPPDGRAGKNAPYVDKVNYDDIVVPDEDSEDFPWMKADKSELYDPDVDKFYLDPWGMSYHYRECKSQRSREDWMINRDKFDLWSYGPDMINHSIEGMPEDDSEGELIDDIGNWSW